MMRWPGVLPAGRVVDEVVQTIDVMPTLLAISGLAAPMEVQGQSLVPLIRPGGGGGGAIVAAASSHLGEGDHRVRPKERHLGRTTPGRSRLSRAAGS